MKISNLISILFCFVIISSFSSCEKEKDAMGTLQFECSVPVLKTSGSAITVTSAMVSINDTKGNSIYSNQKIEILNMNGYYISKPLSIKPGDYVLSSFLLCDNNNTIVYASPVKDSPKAYLVQKPLPIDFKISKDQVSKLVPEVISATDAVPSDFGYATFSFNVVETFDLFIAAFAYEECNKDFYLTDALLTISASGKPSMNFKLENKTNILEIPAGYGEYTLSIKKAGYKTQSRVEKEISLKSFNGQTDSAVMKVILEEGCTLPSGLIAYYPFNGNANDESGNGYHGSIMGATLVNDRNNNTASSFYFDGIDDYIKLPIINELNSISQFTFSCWHYSDYQFTDKYSVIFGHWNSTAGAGDGSIGFELFINGINSPYIGNISASFMSGESPFSNAYFPLNKWTNTVVVYDGTNPDPIKRIQLFINGIFSSYIGNANIPATTGTKADMTIIGAQVYKTLFHFYKGQLDDIAIWNKSLSKEEILNLKDCN